MPYRLRLLSSGRLLVATDHETVVEAGRRAAAFPLSDLMEAAPGERPSASIETSLVFRDEDGLERPATQEEDDELFAVMVAQAGKLADQEMPPCPRCGRTRDDQVQPFPVYAKREGPVCFGCWTPEERERLLPPESGG